MSSPVERHSQIVKRLEALLSNGCEAEATELFFYEYTPVLGIPWWCLSDALIKYRLEKSEV